ncbi:MAG TPA: LysR family transcriptional regulator [Rhodanobacteraceae bacterium]|nr:LysR family transcriptional regulator [Rhodanobacteraceae bacterium]
MSPDFNDSLIFVKVVEHGSFTAAARALGVPKTTVSRRIQQLEERLGARLLKRTTRRLGLTEAGAVYFDHGRRAALELDAAHSAVSQLHGAPRGWLRLTLPYSFGIEVVAPMLPEFFARHPEVRVELLMSDAQLDLVGSDVDLALRIGPLEDSSLSARRLCRYASHVYASADYLRRHGEPLTPDDLRHHRALAMPVQRSGSRHVWALHNGGAVRDYPIDAVFVGNDPASLRAPLLAGVGLALLPDGYADALRASGAGLQRLLEPWQGTERELNVVLPPGRTPPPKVRAFVDFLVERLRRTTCLDVSDSRSVLAGQEAPDRVPQGVPSKPSRNSRSSTPPEPGG